MARRRYDAVPRVTSASIATVAETGRLIERLESSMALGLPGRGHGHALAVPQGEGAARDHLVAGAQPLPAATIFAARLAASTAGLMNMTLPTKVRPGTASVVNSSGCPMRMPERFEDGTSTVRSSSRLSTIRNMGSLLPMFSTRSPTLMLRSATMPFIGEWMNDFASRASPVLTCAVAARLAAPAASRAEAPPPSPRRVPAPRPRLGDRRLCDNGLERLESRLGLGGVQPRESRPFLHGHPLRDVHRRDGAGHLGLHAGRNFRRQRSDDALGARQAGV